MFLFLQLPHLLMMLLAVPKVPAHAKMFPDAMNPKFLKGGFKVHSFCTTIVLRCCAAPSCTEIVMFLQIKFILT